MSQPCEASHGKEDVLDFTMDLDQQLPGSIIERLSPQMDQIVLLVKIAWISQIVHLYDTLIELAAESHFIYVELRYNWHNSDNIKWVFESRL